ncbi:MAG: hypothetical protein H6Q33_582 [Deltaproteobacteria bacterium]|nr:hypothetical protein [Deltaproteobacteria bacterium]
MQHPLYLTGEHGQTPGAGDGLSAESGSGWLALLAGGMAFLVYWRTMAPTVYGVDSAELTTGAYVLGIVHAPGSPVFLLLGHAFAWLPFGDVGYRLNLLSACAAAVAVAFTYAVVARLTGQRLLSLAGAWFLAFSYYFWVTAIAAELYALHACFVIGLIWLALRWREQQRPSQLCLFALFYGLGLGNHLSLSLLAPGFAWLIASGRARLWRRPELLAAAAACGLTGAAVYLYLPLRSAAAPLNFARSSGVDAATWHGFWWMLTCRMFAAQLFAVAPHRLPAELATYLYRLWSNFAGLGSLLGVVGLWADWKRCWRLHLALVLMFAGHLGFMLTYAVGDKELMMLPTYVIWAVWSACGADVVSRALTRWARGGVVISGSVLLLMLSAGNLLMNFGYADISEDRSARLRGETILHGLPPHAVYLGTWLDVPLLQYLQLVEQQRVDVETVNLFFVPTAGRPELLAQHLREGHAMYTGTPDLLPHDGIGFEYTGDCDCYRIVTSPPATTRVTEDGDAPNRASGSGHPR